MSFTPDQYRNHPSAALRRAFFRGEQARVAGTALEANPYRRVTVTKKARRGSWSESFTLAWATGWHHEDRKRNPAETAAAVVDEGVST